VRHVLAVDDDPAIRSMIAEYLSEEGFKVSTASTSREMARLLAEGDIDLVLLDLKLAHEDGLDLVREIRSHSDLPIIVLTGHRRDATDRVVGLEVGADDYVTKPFSLRELLARVRAVLRRSAPDGSPRQPKRDGKRRYRFAGWQLDEQVRRLSSATGEAIPLTRSEFGLLMAFLKSPQQVLSREQLLAASRLHAEDVYDRSVDVQILRLRRKLEANPTEPELIKTERGVGYILTVPVDVL
jgi:two-component system OmpR family response regulator